MGRTLFLADSKAVLVLDAVVLLVVRYKKKKEWRIQVH